METYQPNSIQMIMTIMVMLVLFVGSVWGIVEVGAGALYDNPRYAPKHEMPAEYKDSKPSDHFILSVN